MSINDQCFGMILRNKVVIDDELKEKIIKHITKLFFNKKKFKDDAFDKDEKVPIEVYLGFAWKKRKAACININTRAKDKLEKISNILKKITPKDLEIDEHISLTKPEKIENCDFERYKKKKGDKLWDKLEHNGPYFPHIYDPYKPHGAPILFEGKVVKLNSEEEQMFSFWAKRIITERNGKKLFLKNDQFRQNFLSTLKPYLTKEHQQLFFGKLKNNELIKNFGKFDFSRMVKKIDEMKEEKDELRKSKEPEEKLKEKIDRLERKLNYNYAFINGVKKELKSSAVEVQGLYVGAGNVMTHKGKIKKVINPEDVTINVSEGDEPVPPPGHKWGGIVHDKTAGWTARYKDEITGQYKYVRLKESGDLLKFEKARKLNKFIHVIDEKIDSLLKSNAESNNQKGTVIYLIKNFGFRVGTSESEEIDVEGEDKGEKVVGATTLMVENIKPIAGNKINLRFFGKDSQLYENTLDVSAEIYQNILKFIKNKKPKDKVFHLIDATSVNNYLKSIDRDFTAKVFRTRLASSTMYKGLQKFLKYKKNATDEQKVADFNIVNRDVAIKLNHKKGITEAQKESIKKDEKNIKELKQKLKELKDEEAKKEKIKKLQDSIKIKEVKLKDKKENLGIALETSKKNYIDPRVVKAWAETVGVPINKIYSSKELQKHFAWTIEDDDFGSEWDYEDTELDCIVGSELEPKVDEDKEEVEVKKKVSRSKKDEIKKKVKKDDEEKKVFKRSVVIEKPFIIQYSQRSIAVFGDTKSIKNELKKMGGVFNSSLKYNDQKRPGWIFMNYMRQDVQKLIETEEEVEEISDDEELSLEEVMKKKSKLKDDEAEKINVFCREPTQSNFDKLQKSTKEDFIKFSNLIIRLEKGNINLAKKVIKLKV